MELVSLGAEHADHLVSRSFLVAMPHPNIPASQPPSLPAAVGTSTFPSNTSCQQHRGPENSIAIHPLIDDALKSLGQKVV